MMWKKSKLSGFGSAACRLGAAGFLLLCLALPSLGQELPTPPGELVEQITEYPTMPEQKKIDLEKLSDSEFMMEQSKALQEWIQFSTNQKAWNKKDQSWKISLMTWWNGLKIWLQKRDAAQQEELKKKDDIIADLTTRNIILEGQNKDLQATPWITGAVGAGIGVLVGLLVSGK
jgi:hypothetical protein